MPDFKWKDLLSPEKIASNGHWIVAGAVLGVAVYHFMVNPVFNPETYAIGMRSRTSAISMRSPTQVIETPTYGCASCNETVKNY
jgi:hypothetical protein